MFLLLYKHEPIARYSYKQLSRTITRPFKCAVYLLLAVDA
jgi:hypothetical protein